MAISRYRTYLVWIAIVYATVVGLVLYPTFHEGFGARLGLWNCVPSTLAFLVFATGLGKSRLRLICSTVFAIASAAVTTFFVGAWLLMPVDTDPHSAFTVFVFVFAPLWSIATALIASFVAWIVARRRS